MAELNDLLVKGDARFLGNVYMKGHNTFNDIKVGDTTISADSQTDTLTIEAGDNITLTPDATNDKITVSATDTTYNDVTTTAHGLMTAEDKVKLNGIAEGAEVNQNTFSSITNTDGTITYVSANSKTDKLKITIVSNDLDIRPSREGGLAIAIMPDATLDTASYNVIANAPVATALNSKAIIQTLTNENLNNVTTPGFYNAAGGNSVTNKPSGVEHFGLLVVHDASGSYYTQKLFNDSTQYTRKCVNETWGSWSEDKLTDTIYDEVTTSAAGLMSSSDKTKLNGIESGAQKNTVTGIKGDSESTYRIGNVNITKSNIGLGNVGNFKAVSTVASQGLTDTEKSNARANIGAGTGNGTITGVSMNGTSIATSGVANITSLPASILSGAIKNGVTATTQAAGDNSTKIATTAFVKKAVDDGIGSIIQIKYRVVESLPTTGEEGIIYLVLHEEEIVITSGSTPVNYYDEYIWISDIGKFEKIGTTEVDLSDYVTDTDLATALENYLAKRGGTMLGDIIMGANATHYNNSDGQGNSYDYSLDTTTDGTFRLRLVKKNGNTTIYSDYLLTFDDTSKRLKEKVGNSYETILVDSDLVTITNSEIDEIINS